MTTFVATAREWTVIAMAGKKRCETCTEECAKSQMAHEAAVGRMYATKQFVALQKKIESGQLVEVVRCKDCAHRTEMGNCGHPRYHGILPSAYPYDFCSYGERKEND